MNRLRIKIGNAEIEYEGTQKIETVDLVGILKSALEVTAGSPLLASPTPEVPQDRRDSGGTKSKREWSVTTVAQAIGIDSGSDLVVAACAKLQLVDGTDTPARLKILDTMREATTYFKKSYGSNLSSYISTLVRSGRLHHLEGDCYSLSQSELDEVEGKLHEIT
jgi:hypothetical protein